MDPAPVIGALTSALVATWGTFIAAFFRGDLIPGHVYRREVKRQETSATQMTRNADSLALIAKAHEDERREHATELLAARNEAARWKFKFEDAERQLEARRAPSG